MAAKSYFLLDDKILPMDSEPESKLASNRGADSEILAGKLILVIDDNTDKKGSENIVIV